MIKTIVKYVNFYYGGIASPQNPPAGEDNIKTALVYRFLYEHYVKDYISLETILHRLNGGYAYPSKPPCLRNHLIFHRAFKSFYKHYKAGRGCVYVFDFPIKSEVIGCLTGILYWIFHKGII